MKLIIKDEAKKILKDKVYHIINQNRSGCCGGVMDNPIVERGEPYEISEYNKLESDGVIFYVPVQMKFKNHEVIIDVEDFFLTKKLMVTNFESVLI